MKKNANIRRQRRKDLVEATIAVIAAQGYSGTTVARVAEQARVSVGLMNFHFSGKEMLFRAVFDYLSEDFDNAWAQHLASSPATSEGQLQAMIEAYFLPQIFTPEKLAVWFTFWSDANLRDLYRAPATRIEQRYSKAIVAALRQVLAKKARHRATKPATLARRIAASLLAMIDGYWLQAVIYPTRFVPKAAIKDCSDFINLHISHI